MVVVFMCREYQMVDHKSIHDPALKTFNSALSRDMFFEERK